MTTAALKARRDEIVTRILTLEAEEARQKHEWFASGTSVPLAERSARTAELLALKLERQAIVRALNQAKKTERLIRDASLLAVLLEKLRERGLDDLVTEANRVSLDRLIAVGAVPAEAVQA